MSINEEILWQADDETIKKSHLFKYKNYINTITKQNLETYEELWKWSVDESDDFWSSLIDYFNVYHDGSYRKVTNGKDMPYTKWFEGLRLNYAEHILGRADDNQIAIIAKSEIHEDIIIRYGALRERVAAFQQYLRSVGVKEGDRVVAFITNTPHAVVACLATLSLGAIWSSCSPDFGAESVIERFQQIQPKVLIAVDGYTYNGKIHNKISVVNQIVSALPSLNQVVIVPFLKENNSSDYPLNSAIWENCVEKTGKLSFVRVPFDHPIWILYSSGTTGQPKAITHRHGGMLLEHLKYMAFHNDVHEGERYFWYSTTGWMMWNFALSSMLMNATLVLYEGSPTYPDMNILWEYTQNAKINHFGTSAPYLVACMKRNIRPSAHFDLSGLRSIGSTGSPLPAEAFTYVYNSIGTDIWLSSMSGGTDVCTAFVGGCIMKPIVLGKIQSRGLGCSLYAFNEAGNPIENDLGELVVTKPMPCMPVYFWGDEDFKRYKQSYFDDYHGVWRHGDWITIDDKGMVIISGRSDATLNRQGVRIGTSEIYSSLNKIPEIEDALIVNIEFENGKHFMPLFVKLKDSLVMNIEIKEAIRFQLKTDYSPRHVPDEIFEVADIPHTISGKKMEAPVKKILMGFTPEKAYAADAMRNPESMNFFIENKNLILNSFKSS